MGLFKAFIKVVKSLQSNEESYLFGSNNIIFEPIIEAENKDQVKSYLLSKYPQFFQNNKIYERETKDNAQFFYVQIYPLYEWEKKLIEEGKWECSYCGQMHENKYVSKPYISSKLLGSDHIFCKSDDNHCFNKFIAEKYEMVQFPDDQFYIKADDPIYIYKITEKSTGKSYIGKTKNAPFFRWWNHLKHSVNPFGNYLRSTKLSDWTFEVIEQLPSFVSDEEIFKIESRYIDQYDSIKNGFNIHVSKKDFLQESLFKTQLNQSDVNGNIMDARSVTKR